MDELKRIRWHLKEMAERESMKLFRMARRAQAHGCKQKVVNDIREEAFWLENTATAYPDRLLRWQFEYEMKYAFKSEGRRAV